MHRIFVLCFSLTAATVCAGEEVHIASATPLANGSMTILTKDQVAPTELLVHFHGATESIRQAYARSDLKSVLVVVNFPGLSTAYSQPFEMDNSLFQKILEHAQATVATADATGETQAWRRVSVSSFSAGYGAVREILRQPQHLERIDAIVAADSIYAGLRKSAPDRQVDEQNMRDLLKFASLAADGKKTFVISHSAQPTPYASTTETADYLLRTLQVARQPDTSIQTATMQQRSLASRGRFIVLGFEGGSGKDHMQHLHNIELLWKLLPITSP